MPAGLLVTVPLPTPVLLTVNMKVCRSKFAVTLVAVVIVTTQVPVPEQPPPFQPVKVESVAADAVRVTTVSRSKSKAQVKPQSMPAGSLVIVPPPLPDLVIVKFTKVKSEVLEASFVTVSA